MKNLKSAACTIYHNPRCSKSRATLALLREHGVDPVVVEYLSAPISDTKLKELLAKLGMQPMELLRKSETVYTDKVAGRNLTDAQLIEAMVGDPVLIERPIVVFGARAVLGRPPENVLQLIS